MQHQLNIRAGVRGKISGASIFDMGKFFKSYRLLQKAKVGKVDGILADFGTSQMHIKERAGFSFAIDTLLICVCLPLISK